MVLEQISSSNPRIYTYSHVRKGIKDQWWFHIIFVREDCMLEYITLPPLPYLEVSLCFRVSNRCVLDWYQFYWFYSALPCEIFLWFAGLFFIGTCCSSLLWNKGGFVAFWNVSSFGYKVLLRHSWHHCFVVINFKKTCQILLDTCNLIWF